MILLLSLLCLQDSEEVGRLLEEGKACHSKGQFEKALEFFEEALQKDPENSSAWVSKGMTLMALRRRDEAMECWDEALKIDPNLRRMIEELKSGRPERRPPHDEEAELRRIEDKLQHPDLPAEERERLNRRAEEIRGRLWHREGPMSPEEVERLLQEMKKYLEENDPETLRRVERLVTDRRFEEAGHSLREVQIRRREMEEWKKRDPDHYARMVKVRELERASSEFAEKIRRGGHGVEELRKQLVTTLEQLFDLREEIRSRELAELKKRVEELEKVLQQRRENKQKIVEKRIRQMTGEKDPEDW